MTEAQLIDLLVRLARALLFAGLVGFFAWVGLLVVGVNADPLTAFGCACFVVALFPRRWLSVVTRGSWWSC